MAPTRSDRGRSDRWIVASLRAGQSAELVLSGWSMAPALRDGDVLSVEPVGSRPLAVGEVVLAERGERLVAHRVISVADGVVVTRGDAGSVDDPPLGSDEILGRVTRHRRRAWSWLVGRLGPLRRLGRRLPVLLGVLLLNALY